LWDALRGQRQAVAVARAAAWGERVVTMDEPTAAESTTSDAVSIMTGAHPAPEGSSRGHGA
jgi:ABC-type sugar transport system ATPase subunit